MHAATARWIADRTEGAMGEDAEIVVHHLDAALGARSFAPELDTEPITELLTDAVTRAGESAMRTELPRAIPHLERGLELIPIDDRRRTGALRSLGLAEGVTGNPGSSVKLLEELVGLHRAVGDDEAEVDAAINLHGVMWAMGEGMVALLALRDPGPTRYDLEPFALETLGRGVGTDGHRKRLNEAAARLAQESIAMAETRHRSSPSGSFSIEG